MKFILIALLSLFLPLKTFAIPEDEMRLESAIEDLEEQGKQDLTLEELDLEGADLTEIFAKAMPSTHTLTLKKCNFKGVTIGDITSNKHDKTFQDLVNPQDDDERTPKVFNASSIIFEDCSFKGAKINFMFFGTVHNTSFKGAHLRNVWIGYQGFEEEDGENEGSNAKTTLSQLNFDNVRFYYLALSADLIEECGFQNILGEYLIFDRQTTFKACQFGGLHVSHFDAEEAIFDENCDCNKMTVTSAFLDDSVFRDTVTDTYLMGTISMGIRTTACRPDTMAAFLKGNNIEGTFNNMPKGVDVDLLSQPAYKHIFWPPQKKKRSPPASVPSGGPPSGNIWGGMNAPPSTGGSTSSIWAPLQNHGTNPRPPSENPHFRQPGEQRYLPQNPQWWSTKGVLDYMFGGRGRK